jgi:hypothetical protein
MHAKDRVYAANPLFFKANRASFLVNGVVLRELSTAV